MRTLMTETQVAQILRVSRAALRRWRREHRGPAYLKVERVIRYDPAAVEEFLSAAVLRQQQQHRDTRPEKREPQKAK